MQKITLLGNLGKDPEERHTNAGKKVVSFSLAVSPKKDQTVWYDCQIWEGRVDLFKNIIAHLKKGSRVLIGGDLQAPETYTAKDGSTKVNMKVNPNYIQFVGAPKEQETVGSESPSIFENPKEEIPF